MTTEPEHSTFAPPNSRALQADEQLGTRKDKERNNGPRDVAQSTLAGRRVRQ